MKVKVSDLRNNASGMKRVICMIIVVVVYEFMDLILGKMVFVSVNKNDLKNDNAYLLIDSSFMVLSRYNVKNTD